MAMRRSQGFSLLEAMLATGILSVVLAQIVSIHANSLAASQAAIDNVKATWALRSAVAQIEYISDVYGSKDGLRPEVKVPWGADPNFQIEIFAKPISIEASRLLMTFLKIGQALSGTQTEEGGNEDNPAEMISGIASQLDAIVPKDIYKQVSIQVNWKQGEQSKGIDSGIFLIDSKMLKPDLGALSSMVGAGGPGANIPGSIPGNIPGSNPGNTPDNDASGGGNP